MIPGIIIASVTTALLMLALHFLKRKLLRAAKIMHQNNKDRPGSGVR